MLLGKIPTSLTVSSHTVSFLLIAKLFLTNGRLSMLNRQQIPEKFSNEINLELEPGEFICWVGQPIPGYITAQVLVSILIFTGLALLVFL